jgi:Lon protease-like protein
MAVLEPGWEDDYESRPPVVEYACLGKVVAHHKLKDGHYNVLLMGVHRVRIIKELEPLRSFRKARVELLEDCYDFDTPADRKKMHERLLTAFRKHLPCACQLPEQLESMLTDELPLGLLTDLAAYALPLEGDVKQQLLAENRVRCRAEILLSEVEKLAAAATEEPALRKFPPSFSEN